VKDEDMRKNGGGQRRDTLGYWRNTGAVGMVGEKGWKMKWNINNGCSDSVSQETKLT
jgi:hypothetical protein